MSSSPVHAEIANRALKSGNCLCVLAAGLCESLTVSAIASRLGSSPIPPLIVLLSDSDPMITGETSTNQRERIYSSGGIVTVTARVLLSDLLACRLDAGLIRLIILTRAHEASDTSNEAFLIRVFRERNGSGLFIGLTEKPQAISVEVFVKTFLVSDVILVPRFHEVCLQSMTKDLPIRQHDCPLTARQVEMQGLLESIVGASIEEIKRNKIMPLDDLDARSIISNKNEVFNLRRRLESVWLKLSWAARQVVSDLGVIRQLLVALVRYDSVHFLSILLTHQQVNGKTSPWWFSEDAQRLVRLARERVSLDSQIEVPSTWSVIEEIVSLQSKLASPSEEAKKARTIRSIKTLIIAPDDLVAKQLIAFVSEGAQKSLLDCLTRQPAIGVPYGTIENAIASSSSTSLEAIDLESNSRSEVHVTACHDDSFNVVSFLCEYQPETVILIEPSLVAIRAIELYQLSSTLDREIQLHVLHHSQSVVELQFPFLIDREAKAFDDIIKLKSALTFHAPNELYEQKKRQNDLVVKRSNSRQGGSMRTNTVNDLLKQTVLVDVRELRSALPFLLYKKEFDIVPTTLSIGDYILSRDIAVERKSVTGNDLQQSLISGRLYKQLVNLTHAFPWPIILLEFTTGRTFQLQATDAMSGEINPSSLIAQIIAIIIHFPSVRLMWSPAFGFTANVFARLKQGRQQPRIDPASKEALSAGDPTAHAKSATAKRAIEFLKACPGITAANLPNVLKRTKSIRELVELTSQELTNLLGKRDGALFYRFIHHKT